MPKKEETSQVRDTPLDVWVHRAPVPGRACAGSVAKSSCFICPRGTICGEEGSECSVDAGQISAMEGRALAGRKSKLVDF